MKKKTRIILISIVLAICAVAAALWFFLLRSQQDVLYFNIDGYTYQDPGNSNISTRTPDANGVYRIDFFSNGTSITCTTSDKDLVNRIDSQQVLALQINNDSQIQSASVPEHPLADRLFVQEIKEKELILNNSFAFDSKQTTIALAENCRFYDLTNGGVDTQPELMDKVLIYGDALGRATDVFILYRTPYSDLYWRLSRKYDTETNATSRQPDANGVYTAKFSFNGEHVELKTKDGTVMTAIDAPDSSNAAMGLILDEDGYITQMLPAYRALRGREMCNAYDVTAIDGNRITVKNKLGDSQIRQIVLGEDCQIFDVSSGAELCGQKVPRLQVGDRVTVYADPLGVATHIFIRVRILEGPLYYNLMRMYINNRTMRLPDNDGWYSFAMLCDGQVLTLKTKDLDIANKVDSYSSCGMGLKLDGDVITGVYDVSCVTGNGLLASNRYVQSFSPSLVVSGNASYKRLSYTLLHTDCKVYDVSASAAGAMASETELRADDCFVAFGDADKLATHIFIIKRTT